MTFHSPVWLALFPVVALITGWLLLRQRRTRAPLAMAVAAPDILQALPHTVRERIRWLPLLCRLLGVSALLVALAGPQVPVRATASEVRGIDVVVLLDVSLSMSAEDFAPNRLGAAARAAQALVARRPHDRFGVMTFAGDVQMNCPLTTDHAAVIECLGTAVIEGRAGGTALGEAIAQAANGLRRSGDGGRAVLLLTDGGQNAGPIDAVQAASAAATLGIRVYTGGIGSNEPAPVPTEMGRQMVPLDLDESTLRQVASVARGRYFRVADETSLMRMSEEFDRMQPAPYMVRHTSGQASVAHAFALAMIAALALEVALACTVCRAVP